MKIIFDSEEQKKELIKMLHLDYCPSFLYLNESCKFDAEQKFTRDCKKCWENCGIEMEINR